jgi:hypothetical protein
MALSRRASTSRGSGPLVSAGPSPFAARAAFRSHSRSVVREMPSSTAAGRRPRAPTRSRACPTCDGVYTFATRGRAVGRGPGDAGGGSGGTTTGDGGGATTPTGATGGAAASTHVQSVVFGSPSRRAAGVIPSFRAASTAAAFCVAVYCRGCAVPMLTLGASTASRTVAAGRDPRDFAGMRARPAS